VGCLGYRDPLDAVFRDVTRDVAKRVQKQKAEVDYRPKNKRSPSTSELAPKGTIQAASTASPSEPDIDAETSISPLLTLQPEDVATNFFLCFYIPESSFAYFNQVLDHAIIDTGNPAFLSAGLAVLSHQLKQPSLLKVARKYYSEAITSTNAALASPSLATQDVTLVSILLLGVFEAHVFHGRATPEAWIAHTHGAATLLELRGMRQFETELSTALFIHAAINIRTLCIQHRVRIPPAILSLQRHADRIVSSEDPRWRLAFVLDTLAQFLSDVPRFMQEQAHDADLADLIARARGLDTEVIDLMEELSSIWPVEILSKTHAPNHTYEAKLVHRYPSQRAARFWNNLRLIRHFVNDWICEAALAIQRYPHLAVTKAPEPPLRLGESAATIVEIMSKDILASVPFILQPSSLMSSAKNLIWPLSAIAVSKNSPSSARFFAVDMLQKLGKDYGVSQATFAAEMTRERTYMEDW
jgi:Fungal specific transcription factor domain